MNEDPMYPRFVFVLTDGHDSNQANVFKVIRANKSKARVHSFGIGSGASQELVNGMAERGNGYAHFIENVSNLNSQVINALTLAVLPAYSNVQRNLGTLDASMKFLSPIIPPNIYMDEYSTTFGCFDGDKFNSEGVVDIKASDTLNQEPVSF